MRAKRIFSLRNSEDSQCFSVKQLFSLFRYLRQISNDGKPRQCMNQQAFEITFIRIEMLVRLVTRKSQTNRNHNKHKYNSEVGSFSITWK